MLGSGSYDVIHVDHLQMAQFVPDNEQILNILDEHNVEWRIIERIAHSDGSLLKRSLAKIEYPKLRQFEKEMCMRAHYVLTVTDEDKSALGQLVGRVAGSPGYPLIETIPIGVDTDYFSHSWQRDQRDKCVFVGTMYWPPNVDSVIHFCQDILPLAKKDLPELAFEVVGLRPTRAVLELQERMPSVHVTGSVDDVRPYMSHSRAFVVPLRAGSGMRVKILNAMATGVPVVTTSIGCEGIDGLVPVREPSCADANREANVWIADTPQEFAGAVVALTRDDELAASISRNGRELMVERYDWRIISQRVLDLYARIETDLEKRRADIA
jgi:glycosyltransferase involved in cell wall biosynthesis